MEPHSHAPQPQPSRVECPRCGFALDGSRDASRARGETEGICTECGLSVEWRQLEDASGDPAWFVESRLKPLGLARRAIATVLRLAWPWGFWSQVSMRTPLSARGIAAFLLVLACVAHGVAALGRIERNAPRWGRTAPGTVDHIVAVVTPLNRYYGTSIMISARLPDPPSSAWERTIRIAHGFVYSIDFTGLVPPRPGLYPFAPQIVDPVTTSRLASAALVPVLAPCMLLLLPISMRRARVRFRHIARAAIYSLALLVPLFALALYACIANWHLYIGTQDWIGRMRPHVLTVAAALVTLPWLAAIVARYLRLPRAWPVALACTAIATLLSLAVSALQFDRL